MTRSIVAVLLAVLALPAIAQAQGRGVFVDPDSPAGTEYAIPLEEARRQAAPSSAQRSGGRDADQPLFGEGIERAQSGTAAGAGSADSAGGGGRSGEGGDGTGGARQGAEGEALGVREMARAGRGGSMAVEAAAQGGSDALLTAGIGGTVLAVGLLVGFGLRRVLRSE